MSLPQVKRVAIDIHDIYGTSHAEVIVRHLLSNGGVLYRTARGRTAILLDKPIFERVKASMKLGTAEALDGLVSLVFPS